MGSVSNTWKVSVSRTIASTHHGFGVIDFFSRIDPSLKIQHHYCNRPKTNLTHVAGLSTQQKINKTLLVTSYYLTEQQTSVMSQVGRPVFQFRTLQPEVHQPIATSLPATAPPVQQAVFGGESELPKKHTHDWQLPTKSQLFFR